MILQFLWIEDYRNIQNQGFNFGGELYFQFQEMENETYLKATLNGKYIPNLFQLPDSTKTVRPVCNITAVVGENGAGKTNLLSFILTLLNRNPLGDNYLAVFQDGQDLSVYMSGLSPFSLIGLENEVIEWDPSTREHRCWERNVTLNHGSPVRSRIPNTIFYSPIMDWRFMGEDGPNNPLGIDVSTNFLAYEDYDKQQFGRESSWHNAFFYHKWENIKRQLAFTFKADSYGELLSSIPIPGQLRITTEALKGVEVANVALNNLPEDFRLCYPILKEALYQHTFTERDAISNAEENGDQENMELHERGRMRAIFMLNLFRAIFHNLNSTNHFLDNLAGSHFSVRIDQGDLSSVAPTNILQSFLRNQDLFEAGPILNLIEEMDRLLKLGTTSVEFASRSIFIARDESERLLSIYEKFIHSLWRFVESNSRVDHTPRQLWNRGYDIEFWRI
jgi:hypothetical protein